jgi:hypothetical protein
MKELSEKTLKSLKQYYSGDVKSFDTVEELFKELGSKKIINEM